MTQIHALIYFITNTQYVIALKYVKLSCSNTIFDENQIKTTIAVWKYVWHLSGKTTHFSDPLNFDNVTLSSHKLLYMYIWE